MDQFLRVAQEAAHQAGVLLQANWLQTKTIEVKTDIVDLVTNVDKAADALITGMVRARFPTAEIVGRWAPPFTRELPGLPGEIRDQIARVRPEVIWVGLGCPRQEKWMLRHARSLAPSVLVGVGAAFDFLAGTKPAAPLWMQRAGLEWLFRLISEPRRLAWRYLSTNPKFLWRVAGQIARHRLALARSR